MKNKSLALLLASAVLAGLFAFALPAFADNSCKATVSGVRQGVHSATLADSSIDSVLWPPNHKLRTISISASGSHGQCDVTITDVRQTEAIDAPGSGNTSPDATNCNNSGNTSKIDLRAERSGINDSRYYRVDFTMTDSDGSSNDTAVVLVPHDQGVKRTYSSSDAATAQFPSYDGTALSCKN
ncbi:MAG: hypothetical protein ABR507_08560 [Actinomycetota bacterium]|nr:hypothetical protein [Actinomycetota bacterium]